MTRWRRPGAGEILLVYLLLAAAGFTVSWLSRSAGPYYPLPSFLVTAFLAWRVSRGGRISRVILIIVSCASYAVAVLAVARLWDLTVLALVIICAVQVVLLASPPAQAPVRMRGWAQLVLQPPAWLLPWGLLAGALLTLACLRNMDWVTVAGCRPAASSACTALAEGYPLRWLTAYRNEPVISKVALLKDCAQWTLASMSVLYLAWFWLPAPASLRD